MQTRQALKTLQMLGHATNQELHAALATEMPSLSLYSLHRITARLLERGEIRLGPSEGRRMLLDANAHPHDHFVCTSCGGIVDIAVPEAAIDTIQRQLGRNIVRDGIVVYGRCESCGSAADTSATT